MPHINVSNVLYYTPNSNCHYFYRKWITVVQHPLNICLNKVIISMKKKDSHLRRFFGYLRCLFNGLERPDENFDVKSQDDCSKYF